MNNSQFLIRHGEFHDIAGRAARGDRITLLPARITLLGTSIASVHSLSDYLGSASAEERGIIDPDSNAPWVLGRLMYLFGTEVIPEEDRGEKSCLYASFVAVFHELQNLTVPFACSDYYASTSLQFSSEDPPSDAIQSAIADHFWSLLLASPQEVCDYQARIYHSGAGEWFDFGVSHGQPFIDCADRNN